MRSGFHAAIDLATAAAGHWAGSLQSWIEQPLELHLTRQPVSPQTAMRTGVLPMFFRGRATPLIDALAVPAGTTAAKAAAAVVAPRTVMAVPFIDGQVEPAGRMVRAMSVPPGAYWTHVGFAAWSGYTTSRERRANPHFRMRRSVALAQPADGSEAVRKGCAALLHAVCARAHLPCSIATRRVRACALAVQHCCILCAHVRTWLRVECAGHAGAVTAAAWPPHSRRAGRAEPYDSSRRHAAQNRLRRPGDVVLARHPVRDRDAHRAEAVPGGAGHPAGAFALGAGDGRARQLVAVAETHQDLVEHDVVEDPHARIAAEELGHLRGARAAAVDQGLDTAPSEVAEGGVDGEAAGAAGELGGELEGIALLAAAVLEVLRGDGHGSAVREGVAHDDDAVVVRDVEPLVRVGGPRVSELRAIEERALGAAGTGPQSERAVDVEPPAARVHGLGDLPQRIDGAGVDVARS